MARTCCPLYTIRLDAEAFKPNKKHRQVMNRWNRFLETGIKPGADTELMSDPVAEQSSSGRAPNATPSGQGKGKGKGKQKAAEVEDWADALRQFEVGYGSGGKHRFEVSSVPVLICLLREQRAIESGTDLECAQVSFVPAEATDETYDLYKRYQMAVHKDAESKVTRRGFERFLCNSPLLVRPRCVIHRAP